MERFDVVVVGAGPAGSLAAKAAEVLADLDDPKNPLAAKRMAIVRIDREFDEELLKVTSCDKSKILALVAALLYLGSLKALRLLRIVVQTIKQGGIPLGMHESPKVNGSICIHIFDECLEVKLVKPA